MMMMCLIYTHLKMVTNDVISVDYSIQQQQQQIPTS